VDITKARGDGKLLADMLLKGLSMVRNIGDEQLRITALGDPGDPGAFKDAHGRVWQQWLLPVPHADAAVILAAVPVPDGYVGFVRQSATAGLQRLAQDMRFMADFLLAPYAGTLPQWRAFLADARLRPDSFGEWKVALDPAGTIGLQTSRLMLLPDKSVLPVTDESWLRIIPGTIMDEGKPVWGVLALTLAVDESPTSARITVIRRARPSQDAGQQLLTQWNDMTQQRGRYTGTPRQEQGKVTIEKTVPPDGVDRAEASFLYELSYEAPQGAQTDAQRAGNTLRDMFAVLE